MYSNLLKIAQSISKKSRISFALGLMGDLDAATRHMKSALSINADNYDALMLKAVLLTKKKKGNEAVDVFSHILLKHPGNREAVALLANIYISQSKLNKAIELLDVGLSHNKNNVQLLLQLAQVYVAVLKMDEAEDILSKVISIEPDEIQHRFNLSSFYVRNGRVEDAENVLRQLIKENPDDERRYLKLVDFLADNKSLILLFQYQTQLYSYPVFLIKELQPQIHHFLTPFLLKSRLFSFRKNGLPFFCLSILFFCFQYQLSGLFLSHYVCT